MNSPGLRRRRGAGTARAKARPTSAGESKWRKSVSGPKTTAEQTAKAAATTEVRINGEYELRG